MAEIKPSEVRLHVPPLVGTLGRSEYEHAAALIVRTCQVNGDAWAAVTPQQIGKAITEDLDGKVEPLHSLNRNPFFRPDIRGLVAAGHARFVGDGPTLGPVELTEAAIAKIAAGPNPKK